MNNGPYRMLIAPDAYPGKRYRGRYIYEHHLVWWEHTGGVLNTRIHFLLHIDGDRRNNAFANLRKVMRQGHTEKAQKTTEWVALVCGTCGQEFQREARRTIRQKPERSVFYCSLSCGAKASAKRRKEQGRERA